MAGAWTTLTILDGGSASRSIRVWDESGAGTGPYSFGSPMRIGDNGVDAGDGTGGSATQRVIIDNSQVGAAGQKAPSSSVSVIDANLTAQYVAAGSTAQQLGTGAATDFLSHVLIIPAAANCGAVSLLWDGTNTRTLFAGGGTVALPTLAPFPVAFGGQSGDSGGFKLTTGTNVAAVTFGKY